MGKSTISMAIFNCYVSSPEGILNLPCWPWHIWHPRAFRLMAMALGIGPSRCAALLAHQQGAKVRQHLEAWGIYYPKTPCQARKNVDERLVKIVKARILWDILRFLVQLDLGFYGSVHPNRRLGCHGFRRSKVGSTQLTQAKRKAKRRSAQPRETKKKAGHQVKWK